MIPDLLDPAASQWALVALTVAAIFVAARANRIARNANTESGRAADASERSATSAEQSAEMAKAIADIERRRLDLELTPRFELTCNEDAAATLKNRGPRHYDEVEVQLLDYGDDRPVRGFERDMISVGFRLTDVPVNHTETLRFARGTDEGGRIPIRLTCHTDDDDDARDAYVECDLPPKPQPPRVTWIE